jgi:hypothetical protein
MLCEKGVPVILRGVLRLLVTANVAPNVPIFITMVNGVIRSSETSALTRAHAVTSQETAFYFIID